MTKVDNEAIGPNTRKNRGGMDGLSALDLGIVSTVIRL